MKVALINHSDTKGGAARATYRIHRALLRLGLESRMYVNQLGSGDWTVQGPNTKWERMLQGFRPAIGALPRRLLRTENPILHSPAFIPSKWPKRLNRLNVDLLHLHWVNGEMLSIAEIGRFKKPVIWTLHDMWAFCGAEHVTEDRRWQEGYKKQNRPSYESGFDLNRWTWNRKIKHWQHPISIVTPSKWLADCVRHSALMQDWPVYVIPNPIDTECWQPVEKTLARQLLHLPSNVPILLFGAIHGVSDLNKGFDLLKSALLALQGQVAGLELIVFGSLAPDSLPDLGFPVHFTGHLHDDISLRILYSAADAMVVPSRVEAFGQTASEAQSCGTPVIAFNTSGLPDIVEHKRTGYLAIPFDIEDLVQGIKWVLHDSQHYKVLCTAAREKVASCFNYSVVAQKYLDAYEQTIEASMYV
jgi:glycosyltransferase involved in cell wall biosynthesis